MTPFPRADGLMKKQVAPQTRSSSASASFNGAVARRGEFHCGVSARGPICNQPTASSPMKASTPGGGPFMMRRLINAFALAPRIAT